MSSAKEAPGFRVGSVEEIPPGARKIVDLNGKSVGVFNVNGQFVAWLNVCPHELAPVCVGRVRGTSLPSPPGEFRWARENEIVACPWHGWEFDLLTGECLTDRRKLKKYDVLIEDGTIYLK
jgi:3-phenylpropionate/trans-cinnamate dioxygenase ferredoxin subunit